MELSSGEEFYIACDNTGTPLAVFSNNGLLLKQVRASVYNFLLRRAAGQLVFCTRPHRCIIQRTGRFTLTPTRTLCWSSDFTEAFTIR